MPLLEIDDVSVRFGGVAAVDRVSLDADEGAVTGLIGPNGAGKTTLFNVICGLQAPTQGKVIFDGQDVTRLKPHHRARLGIGRTFQKLEIFGSLTVRENQLVAAEARQRWVWDGSEPRAVADHAVSTIGLQSVANERADSLPTGLMRLVEFGRALAAKPRMLLLDEVSSGLSDEEVQEVAGLMRELAAEGLGILLVGHDMELVMEVCTRVHVLEFGKIIAAGTPQEVQANEAVREAYLGTAQVEETA
jgi:branched-chain amino acid transport system ATP-binding protein